MAVIMKRLFPAAFLFLVILMPLSAAADLYQWQDEKGGVHVVDDILLVPSKYKNKVKVIKTKPSEQAPAQQDIQPPQQTPTPSEQEELYGEHPLSWWKEEFSQKKQEISEIKKTIEEQKSYIADYEQGRRLYRLYSKEDTEKYETYKNNLPDNENQLNELKADLEALRDKARIYGVPRKVRE